jgi:hypothetical protein
MRNYLLAAREEQLKEIAAGAPVNKNQFAMAAVYTCVIFSQGFIKK